MELPFFLSDEGKHYLLTAKHVLLDKAETERHRLHFRNNRDVIFNIIFRVLALDEFAVNPGHKPAFLMNLNAGGGDENFMFSDDALDLAIICLDRSITGRKFIDDLLHQGYIPITTADIAPGPSEEGQEVFTVGYPGATSHVGNMSLEPELLPWASTLVATPVFSFGRVSMKSQHLNYFWTDQSIYPGNSGGPVIADNRLIGIVSAQATTRIEKSSEDLLVRIPFGKIINAQHMLELLEVYKTNHP